MEKYLNIENFDIRKAIAKIRCCSHSLEIEKGRHNNIARVDRICKLCDKGEVETELHFLLSCNKYDSLRSKYDIDDCPSVFELMNNIGQDELGKFLIEAFSLRENTLRPSSK